MVVIVKRGNENNEGKHIRASKIINMDREKLRTNRTRETIATMAAEEAVTSRRLGADQDALPAGGFGLFIDVRFVFGRAIGFIRIAAAHASAVELDSVTGTGDAVSFTRAA